MFRFGLHHNPSMCPMLLYACYVRKFKALETGTNGAMIRKVAIGVNLN